jgi:hypothetical protein
MAQGFPWPQLHNLGIGPKFSNIANFRNKTLKPHAYVHRNHHSDMMNIFIFTVHKWLCYQLVHKLLESQNFYVTDVVVRSHLSPFAILDTSIVLLYLYFMVTPVSFSSNSTVLDAGYWYCTTGDCSSSANLQLYWPENFTVRHSKRTYKC